MKRLFSLLLACLLAACSSMIPYKDQNLDYLNGIEQNPDAYRGQVVSFGGEVQGTTEDTLRLRLVLKIDAPLYYYATGKGDSLSYELLLVSFNKKGMPQMTGLQKGHHIKVLARVSSYEKRKNFTGKDIAVLHLLAFAITDRTANKDFFRPESPDRQLYESWKKGRLFFEDSAQDIIKKYPAPAPIKFVPVAVQPTEVKEEPKAEKQPEKALVFDPEDPPFILPPDPKPEENETEEALQNSAENKEQASDKTAEPEQENEPQTPVSEPENAALEAEAASAEPEENSADLPKNDLLTEQKEPENEKISESVSEPSPADFSDEKKAENLPSSDGKTTLTDGENAPLN
ncbi:hypothetical protein [Candidatus Avelusimicrobium sp.]|uniref:hypothetical protein n=1 Tax=Candidatus Avelusimicrobium sp. TaxID=3048833 RepID=UPI003D7CD726